MKILLATDGSKHSSAAIHMVSNFRLESGDEIRAISVIDVSIPITFDTYAGYIPDTTEIKKVAQENAENTLKKTEQALRAKLNDESVRIETEILSGSPQSEIVEMAEEMKADVIIVGSRGHNRWERLLLGSVSSSVVNHAPCSVFIVRTSG